MQLQAPYTVYGTDTRRIRASPVTVPATRLPHTVDGRKLYGRNRIRLRCTALPGDWYMNQVHVPVDVPGGIDIVNDAPLY